MSIKENITISSLKQYCNFIFPDQKKEEYTTNSFVDKLSIRAHSIQQKIMTLSGGNQQKVVFSRLLALEPKVLILDEPTRGVDVGAKADMFSLIHELADNGIGIIFIDFIDSDNNGNTGGFGMVDGFLGLRHHPVICSYN